ncbi:transposase [Chryseobacterium pennipullorum]|uniref:Transposase n=1 Tax=Chryseobacterium pennipullorum TaxID=2258963 RepID=A0A3D9AKK1_9FLAO|nr:transposase [Chryseobacterium pennipullorum]REC41602.1 transposase [Chryseobacterium pennipullorum]
MKPEEFVKILNKEVIEGNLELYKNLLDTTTEAQDPIWKGILPMYINFSKEEKDVFLKFLRIVEINTLSHVFGILDGSTYAEGIDDNFTLTTELDNEKVNEDLQNLFLELVEE